jgi:hypothetical protein
VEKKQSNKTLPQPLEEYVMISSDGYEDGRGGMSGDSQPSQNTFVTLQG